MGGGPSQLGPSPLQKAREMTVTAADIKTRFPEFASVDSTTITRWITEAERNHNASAWSGKSDDGLAYMVAHFLTAFPGTECDGPIGLGAGALTSTNEGQVGASWSPLTIPKAFTKDDFGTTKYGRRYLSLLDSLFVSRCT